MQGELSLPKESFTTVLFYLLPQIGQAEMLPPILLLKV